MSTRKLKAVSVLLTSRDALRRTIWVYVQRSPVKAQTPFSTYLSAFSSGTRPVVETSSRAMIQHLQPLFRRFNAWLTVLSSLFARQCHAIAAQRVRRAAQIVALYGSLGYDRRCLQTVVSRVGTALLRRIGDRPRRLLWCLVIFAWERETISDEEISRCISGNDFRICTLLDSWHLLIHIWIKNACENNMLYSTVFSILFFSL